MALTQSEKREIESLIRKEIKEFMGSNTAKQFEKYLKSATGRAFISKRLLRNEK